MTSVESVRPASQRWSDWVWASCVVCRRTRRTTMYIAERGPCDHGDMWEVPTLSGRGGWSTNVEIHGKFRKEVPVQ